MLVDKATPSAHKSCLRWTVFAVWPLRRSQALGTMPLSVLHPGPGFGREIGDPSDGVERNHARVEERVEVLSQKQAILRVVRTRTDVWVDVSAFQRSGYRAGGQTAPT